MVIFEFFLKLFLTFSPKYKIKLKYELGIRVLVVLVSASLIKKKLISPLFQETSQWINPGYHDIYLYVNEFTFGYIINYNISINMYTYLHKISSI